jgi:hypothetical protein
MTKKIRAAMTEMVLMERQVPPSGNLFFAIKKKAAK